MVVSKYITKFIVISRNRVELRKSTIDTLLDEFPSSIESEYPIDFYYNEDVIISGNAYIVGNVKTEIEIDNNTVLFIKHVEITLQKNENEDEIDSDDVSAEFNEMFF